MDHFLDAVSELLLQKPDVFVASFAMILAVTVYLSARITLRRPLDSRIFSLVLYAGIAIGGSFLLLVGVIRPGLLQAIVDKSPMLFVFIALSNLLSSSLSVLNIIREESKKGHETQ
jgi:hypothetical protein